jgi:RHH-type proline utilization regulon transcriptional repressor/proline dehydrogenase/delta 1-pyrroline-5-carboxylate dehydrogenase
VLAKPAEQTPLIAAQAVRALHEAGVPRAVVQLLPGRGETVGAAITSDARVRGIAFTGSTGVARIIQRTLADRADEKPLALIAETGGQNAMIVDSSALAEQVVADALASAFDSAGQRCSALRVLCLQDDIADRVLEMLEGAMAELVVGDPADLATDVGPVIDSAAKAMLESYIEAMRKRARVHQVPAHVAFAQRAGGTFVAPALVEIDRLRELEREVFGPVLHVLRFRREALDDLVDGINALGYGLTLGIHSRVDETIEAVTRRARVGNVYVNRNIIGAVVGVQPFGGEGLSGTGPKAGGPLYLHAFLARTPDDSAVTQLRALGAGAAQSTDEPFAAFARWCEGRSRDLGAFCARLREITPSGICVALPGPSGEENT